MMNGKNVKKSGLGKEKIAVAAVLILLVAGGGYWYFGINSSGGWPANLAGIRFDSPTVSSNKISLPVDTVKGDKLVFMDVKLDTPQQQLVYKNRVIPLSYYRNGEYLPIIVVYTPDGNIISGIRVCEPCGSFSFHVIEGKYLRCDTCGTQWDIETFSGVSGGCQPYPPPRLPSTIADNVTIDLSAVGLKLA